MKFHKGHNGKRRTMRRILAQVNHINEYGGTASDRYDAILELSFKAHIMITPVPQDDELWTQAKKIRDILTNLSWQSERNHALYLVYG